MSGWRLFVAGVIPDEAGSELWRAMEPLRRRYPEARWVPRENLHVTLVFLGSIDPALVPGIATSVARHAARCPAVGLVTDQAGGRADDRRGGVAWLRLRGPGHWHLRRLARDLARDLPVGRGRGTEHSPHLTVARGVSEAILTDMAAAPPTGIACVVDRVALFRSYIGTGGARYETLAVAALGPAGVEPSTQA